MSPVSVKQYLCDVLTSFSVLLMALLTVTVSKELALAEAVNLVLTLSVIFHGLAGNFGWYAWVRLLG